MAMEQNADIANGQLPLKDVVLCCTALTQDVRSNLTDVAAQMGAVHKLDLTSDVTHLIVASITTPKYRYVAKERPDIKVLAPQWIEAVRQSWMEGGDVDVSALEMKYCLPPFAGLDICVTGFENLEQRNYVSHTIENGGAKYHPDLTKAVTHLIAHRAEGAKYNAARQWGINVVSLKWLEDSIYRSMALDESLYDPVTPDELQGKGAFRRHVRARTSLGKHGRDGEVQSAGGGDASKKRLRRTASTRLESQSQDMWQDMSAHEVHVDRTETDQWQEDDRTTNDISEVASKRSNNTKTSMKDSGTATSSETTAPPDALFSGCYVLVKEFDRKRTELLQKVLEQNGATLVTNTSELDDASRHAFFQGRFMLIPHDRSGQSRDIPDVPASTAIVTEWWIERCLHAKRLLDPVDDVLSTPLGGVEVPEFAELVVSTTGFSSLDIRQAAQAVKLMGATYQQDFGLDTSVLVSGSASVKKEKAFYAKKHHIPVVSAEWLWTWLKTKQKTSYEQFEVSLSALDLGELSARSATVSPAPIDTSQKATKEPAKSGKDEERAKRLSSGRKNHVTPTLPLHLVKDEPVTTLPKPHPILHDDEDDSPSFDSEPLLEPTTAATSRRGSQPLQDVSPNRSPNKTSEPFKDGSVGLKTCNDHQSKVSGPNSPEKLVSPPKLPQIQPPSNDSDQQSLLRPRHELAADLSELLSRQTASRPNSAGPIEPQQRRKHRPLGRAPSGISNRSLSASAQSENDTSPAIPAEVSESAADGFSIAREEPLPPSTQLGYETAEAEALNKKLGARFQDVSGTERVASLGTVKDTLMSTNGIANRSRGRQRTK